MTVTYSKRSLYYSTPQTSWALSYYVPRPIPLDATDTWVKLSQRHVNKLTALSYDLYQTPAYWWTFLTLNPDIIKDPIRDATEGLVIRVASLQRLQALIG